MLPSILASCLLWVAPTVADPLDIKLPPPSRLLSSSNGRFVFGQISDMRRDQFLLDTQTGRMWTLVTSKEGTPGAEVEMRLLEPILFIEVGSSKYSLTPK